MKKVLVLLVLLFACGLALAQQIQSTAIGGNWTAPSTWVGNVVPGAANDVVINGLVYVNNHVTVNNLTIAATGSIMNGAGVNWTLTSNGKFINYGSCEDNTTATLVVYVYGNFGQYGVLVNERMVLCGTAPATLYQHPDAGPIACPYFQSTSSTAEYQLLSDLRFENCQVDFNSRTVRMSREGVDYGISLSGGRLYRVYLGTEDWATLALSDNSYLYAVTAEDIVLQGSVLYYQDNTFQNLTIAAGCTVNTWSGGGYNLIVNEDLYCHGTIDNLAGDVYLRLYGNLYDYGTITATFVYFMGTSNQYVYQDATAAPFANNTFGKPSTVTSGMLWAMSDLRFLNTKVDLMNRPIIMFDDYQSYDIYLDGGQLYRTALGTDDYSHLTMTNDAFMWYTNAGDVILHGIVQSYGSVYFQNVVNMGTMRSWYGGQYFYVYGALTNWGTIANDTDGNTFVRVAGNFTNYGTITCYQIILNGTSNQYCIIQGSVAPSRFTLYSMIGVASWLYNGVAQPPISGSDYMDVNPYLYGVWQPIAATPGRLITFGAGLALGTPQNLTITETGGMIKLTWDQVENSAYYKVLTASAPEGPYTPLPDYAYDGILSDGIVRHTLDSVATPLFIRIRAAN